MQLTETNIYVRKNALSRSERLRALLKHVASKHGASVEDAMGRSRLPNIIRARREFWYHALREFGCSAQWLARYLNRKSHETVRIGIAMHCVQNNLPFPAGYRWEFWLHRRETQQIRHKR